MVSMLALTSAQAHEPVPRDEAAVVLGGCNLEPDRECIKPSTCSEYVVENGVKCPDHYAPSSGTECPDKPCVVGCSVDPAELGDGECGTEAYVEDCWDYCGSTPVIVCSGGAKIVGECSYTYSSERERCEALTGCMSEGTSGMCPDMPEGCKQQ